MSASEDGGSEVSRAQDSVQGHLREVWKFVRLLDGNAGGGGAGGGVGGGGSGGGGGGRGSPLEPKGAGWLVDQQWRHFRDRCTRLVERAESRELSVAVVALTKSGKSTLLNALLGSSCLPTNNVPETARICAIQHTPLPEGSIPKLVEASGRTTIGSQAVRQRIQEINEERNDIGNAWRMEQPLEIHAALHALPETEIPAKLSLIDMPGPNEAKSDFLKHIVENLLENIDAAIYVLDYTKLKTIDEAEMLQAIRKINPSLVQRMWNRMFFVVNKFDVASTGHGLNETDTKHYVRNLLRDAGFRLKPEQIILVSANNALLSRLVLDDTADPALRTKFGRLAFGMEYEMVINKDEWLIRAERMLENSGIQRLEENVLSFLYNQSSAVKTIALVDDLVKLLQELGNVASLFRAALSRNLGEMQLSIDRLKEELDSTMMDFDATKSGLQKIEDDMTTKVRYTLQKLRHVLLQRIGYALSDAEEKEARFGEVGSGWRSIHDSFIDLVSQQQPDIGHAETLLRDLNDNVVSQIKSEIEVSWSIVEEIGRERHRELIAHTNDNLDHLSHQIEPVVARELGVRLEPIDIAFQPPRMDIFLQKLDELLKQGIEKHDFQSSSLYQYIMGSNTVAYVFNAKAIRAHFESLCQDATDQCFRTVHELIKAQITSQVHDAEGRLHEYCDRYMQAIQIAIDGRATHISAHSGTIHKVQEDLRAIKRFKMAVTELQRLVESNLRPTAALNGKDSTGSNSDNEAVGNGSDEAVPALLTDAVHLRRQSSGAHRYVPPHSRFQPQDAVVQLMTSGHSLSATADRQGSLTMPEVSEFWEPQNAVTRSISGPGGILPCTDFNPGNGNGNGNAPVPNNGLQKREHQGWRAKQGAPFSPKSDFFRSFDKTMARGGRGGGRRSQGKHKRAESWN